MKCLFIDSRQNHFRINGSVLLKEEWVINGSDGVPPIPDDVAGYTFAGWDKSILYTLEFPQIYPQKPVSIRCL